MGGGGGGVKVPLNVWEVEEAGAKLKDKEDGVEVPLNVCAGGEEAGARPKEKEDGGGKVKSGCCCCCCFCWSKGFCCRAKATSGGEAAVKVLLFLEL